MHHHSQHSRQLTALAAQQALIQQNQQQNQQQQQQQQSQQLSQPQMITPHQLIANPYLNPYGLQLFYGNPALSGSLNASTLVQAQLQAAAVAAASNRTVAPQTMMPWIKDQLEKDLQHTQQQQALYAALWRNKPPEEIASALYRAESGGSSSPKTSQSSPGMEPTKSGHTLSKDDKVPERSHSQKSLPRSSSPRRSHDINGSLPRPFPTPREQTQTSSPVGQGSYPKPPAQPQTYKSVIMKERDHILRLQQEERWKLEEAQARKLQELEREVKRQEDMWRAKITKNPTSNRNDATKKFTGEKERSSQLKQSTRGEKTSSVWGVQHPVPQSIAQIPLTMIDPATFVAAHASKLINDETVLQNGSSDVERNTSSSKTSMSHLEPPRHKYPPSSSSQSVSSRKIWQPPVIPPKPVSSSEKSSLLKPPLKSSEPSPGNLSSSYKGYRLPAPSSVPVKPSNNHVVNIHSLKYSPPSSSPKPRTAASPRSHSEKTVVVKTSPVTSHSDAQTVKYISDRGQASHLAPNRSPTPPLGPLMADGSRARILSEASLRNLYHFPGPLSKPEPKATEATSENVSDQVIINEPHYKVTALTGNHDNTAKVTSTPPSHLVYAKPAMTLRTDMTSREGSPSIGAKEDNEMEVKNVRKRSRNSDDADPSKKMCKEESRVYFPRYNAASHATANLPDVVSTADPVLRELVANGIFGVTTSSIIWRDPTQVVDQYPGTPSKVALKGALMGLKADNGWNLSSSDSTHGASPSSVPTEERGPPSNIPTDERGPPSIQSHSSLNVFPTTSDQQKLPIVCPSKLNQESSNVEPESPSSRHSAPPSKPFDLSLNPLQQSMGPSATVPATVDTSNYKPFAGGSSNSPASDVSAVSDLSWGSNKVKTPSSDSSGTKSAAPPKLKKAWLKRMSDEPNDPAKDSVKCSSPEELPTSPLVIISYPGTPVEEKPPSEPPSPHDDSLDPPSKKSKKKHRNKEKKHKDPDRKKRKHKEGKKSRKSDSDCPTDVCSPSLGSAGMKEGPEDSSLKVLSNSKLFLMGQLDHSEDEVDDSVEGGDIKKSKKKSGAKKIRSEMPTGENGLPISVLLCRKEQARLKRLGEPFMQDAPCHEIIAMNGIATQTLPSGLSSVPKCRECGNAKRKDNSTVFCRFYGFRKLAFINGILHASGFCDPEDSRLCDVRLWLPTMGKSRDSNNKPSLELETCRYIMKHIGGKFCELVRDEKEELTKAALNEGIRWKRPVSGVREMCDACETTLFNLHWVCHKCGFAVCSDCYKIRRGMSVSELEAYDADRNHLYRWMTCTRGKHHAPSQLVPTQIIPSSCLFDLCELAHQACARWSITSQCRCKKGEFFHTPRPTDPTPLLKNHCNSALLSHSAGKVTSSKPDVKTSVNRDSNRFKSYDCESSASPLDWLASIALREQRKSSVASSSIVTSSLVKGIGSEDKTPGKETGKVTLSQQRGGGLLATSSKAAPRSWLCNGQLLQLTDSTSEVNVDTFQLHWFYGMPVMASGASNNLNRDLWRPETFSREHGDESTGSALINCKRGSIITNAFIKDFWNGFESIENRLRDERSGERMILKLKDWPTTEDFIDTMPDKYEDLMRGLPLPQYTARDGKFNMAAHLPDFFVRPDLGPKMYIAYGWVSESDWSQGTTNLHLDISDACNLMVYVGIPNDEPTGAQDALIKIIKEGDADAAQIERAKTHKAGALWHIFKASDTDKIRKLILKVKAEKGILVSEDHDPIHDQQIYLDQTLRRRLREEYGVEGYPLVQCEGDSVFIPAGAPHQVFNLHSCIKVAEDFVSPEHVDKCFKLTEEFRRLSTAHSNHEDKLQLKNIIFHTMKEIVASLSWHEANGGLETGMEAKAAPED